MQAHAITLESILSLSSWSWSHFPVWVDWTCSTSLHTAHENEHGPLGMLVYVLLDVAFD